MIKEITKILNDNKKIQEIQIICLQIGELKARRNAFLLREKDARKIVAEINKLKKKLELKIKSPVSLRDLFGEKIDKGIDRICRESIVISF